MSKSKLIQLETEKWEGLSILTVKTNFLGRASFTIEDNAMETRIHLQCQRQLEAKKYWHDSLVMRELPHRKLEVGN